MLFLIYILLFTDQKKKKKIMKHKILNHEGCIKKKIISYIHIPLSEKNSSTAFSTKIGQYQCKRLVMQS